MRNIVIMLILGWFPTNIFAQEFLLTNPSQNQLWANLENPISVMIENIPAHSIFLTTDNGIIRKYESDSINRVIASFGIIPRKPGSTTIVVNYINNRDTVMIGKYRFVARGLPDLILCTYYAKNDTVNSHVLAAQIALLTEFDPIARLNLDYKCIIKKFSVVIVRGDQCVYANNYEGARLAVELKTKFGELIDNDKVIFYNIVAIGPDNVARKVRTRELTIKNE